MRKPGASSFGLQPDTSADWPSSILLSAAGKPVGQERKKTAGNAPRRVVLTQPPHYGRIGAQPEYDRACPIESAADRAVGAAQFERQYQTLKHGARAVVR